MKQLMVNVMKCNVAWLMQASNLRGSIDQVDTGNLSVHQVGLERKPPLCTNNQHCMVL